MPQVPQRSAGQPPFRLFGLALSTLAIIGLTGVLRLVIALLGSLAATLLLGTEDLLAALARMKDAATLRTDESALVLLQVIGLLVYLSHVLAIAIVGRVRPSLPLAQRVAFADWRGDRQFWWLLGAMLAYVLAAGLVLEGLLPEARDWVALPKSPIGLFLSLMLIVGMAPIAEELLFRGWIFTGLRLQMPFMPALAISALLFALAHFERTFAYALVVFPVGVALGFVRERYGSVKAAMVFHGMFNLFGWIINMVQGS